MDLLTHPPFRATTLRWQPRPGILVLTVVCKATFTLRPGESAVAPEQDPPNDADDHWNDDERRSLHVASDLVPFKRRTDIVVVGHAYAPRSQPVPALMARLVVAGLDKSIEVHADRVWTPDGHLREGSPFVRMPLRWERAAGGPETSNPVGMRADAPPDAYRQVPVPNLQPPGFYVGWSQDVIPPIGFGPIAPSWPTRRSLLHRHAADWDPHVWFDRPLPEDIDAAFFNVAPADQQVDEIRSDERIVLENLHAVHERLVTRLPGLSPRAVVERPGAAPQLLRMRCDSLCIDTDRGVCTLVWRGQVVLTSRDEPGEVVITAEARPREELAETIAPGLVGPSLPFAGGPSPPAAPSPGEDIWQTLVFGEAAKGPVLPFQEGRSPWASPPVAPPPPSPAASAPRSSADGTETIFGGLVPMGHILPFAAEAGAEQPPVLAQGPLSPPLSPMSPSSSWSFRGEVEKPTEKPPPVEWSTDDSRSGRAQPVPAPPPMLGPLSVGLGSAATTHEIPSAKAAERALPPQTSGAPPSELASEPEIAKLPIEQVAAISAEIAEGRAPRAEVLRDHDLTERAWSANEQRWAEAMDEEAANGSNRLRTAHDRAYVEAVEGFRGPILLPEYARLVIALERGRANPTLDALKIQRPALMRIVRLWTKKVAKDAKLEEEARGLLSSMRAG